MIGAIRRMGGYKGWAVMALLLAGSGGCSTLPDQLPLLEPTVAVPSFEGASTLDLAPNGLSLDKAEANLGERAAAESVSFTPSAQSESAESAESGGKPSEPDPAPQAPLSLSQAGYQKDLPEPEEARDEPYDPFQKEEGTVGEIEEYDPWEPFNQAMFTFNRKLDEHVLKPVATVYDKVIPDPLEFGIRNAFNNIRFVPRMMNNLFQGKFKGAGIELGRFLINTSFGLGGLLDYAKEVFDLKTPYEDFGQTLGEYGSKPGPYLVVPFLGSFTVRDGTGFIVDLLLDPFNILLFPFVDVSGWPQVVTNADTITFAQIGIRAGYMVNERSLNIETTFEGVEEATVDLYGAVRNAYLQKRIKAIKE